MRTLAVVPVKSFSSAKQRLSHGLASGARRSLAQAMFSDVLGALRRARALDAIAVVTGDISAEAIARRDGDVRAELRPRQLRAPPRGGEAKRGRVPERRAALALARRRHARRPGRAVVADRRPARAGTAHPRRARAARALRRPRDARARVGRGMSS